MKTILKYTLVSLLTVFVSCKQEETVKPKVTYDTIIKPKSLTNNATKIVIADLPIQITGTDVVLHPIGDYNVSNGSNRSDSYSDGDNFRISNYSEFEISGRMSNIKFQKIGQDSLVSLTDKAIAIQRVSFLRNLADKTKKQVLVYVLEDMDSNKDGKIDSNDIKNLYISDVDGQNLTKLSADYQELLDWNFIESQNKLYFRTIEDINKNGAFDNEDKLHYHFIDLLSKELKVIEYNPV